MDAAGGRVGGRAGVSLGGLVRTASAQPGGRGGEGDGAQDERHVDSDHPRRFRGWGEGQDSGRRWTGHQEGFLKDRDPEAYFFVGEN